MIVKIYPQNPNEAAVRHVAEILRNDGVIVYPTDSVYALGCAINRPKAIERLRKISGKQNEMAIVCADLSLLADYARVDNAVFRVLKRNLPGSVTFILKASPRVPDKFLERRKTVGLRIPDHAVARTIIRELGVPLVTTSVRADDDYLEYMTDPELIDERYANQVDLVVDGGIGNTTASTVVDYSGDEPEIIRQGTHELI